MALYINKIILRSFVFFRASVREIDPYQQAILSFSALTLLPPCSCRNRPQNELLSGGTLSPTLLLALSDPDRSPKICPLVTRILPVFGLRVLNQFRHTGISRHRRRRRQLDCNAQQASYSFLTRKGTP